MGAGNSEPDADQIVGEYAEHRDALLEDAQARYAFVMGQAPVFEGIPLREVDELDAGGLVYRPSAPLPPVTWSRWDVAWGPPLPRTAWGRLKLRLRLARHRARDAWRVWKGEAEAVPWDDL